MKVWRSDDQPPAAKLDYMRYAVAESILPFDLRVEDRIGFRAEIRTGDLGALRLVDICAPSSEAVRDARLIRRWDPEMCTIHLQVRGHPVVEQGGRQVRLAPGDMTLVDLSRRPGLRGARIGRSRWRFPAGCCHCRTAIFGTCPAWRCPGGRALVRWWRR